MLAGREADPIHFRRLCEGHLRAAHGFRHRLTRPATTAEGVSHPLPRHSVSETRNGAPQCAEPRADRAAAARSDSSLIPLSPEQLGCALTESWEALLRHGLPLAPLGEILCRAGQAAREPGRVDETADGGRHLHAHGRISRSEQKLPRTGCRFHHLRTIARGRLNDHKHRHWPLPSATGVQGTARCVRRPGQTVRVDQSRTGEPNLAILSTASSTFTQGRSVSGALRGSCRGQ